MNGAVGIVAALRLEDAQRLALVLRYAALRVNRIHDLVKQDYRRRIAHIIRRMRFSRIQPPLRHGFIKPAGMR